MYLPGNFCSSSVCFGESTLTHVVLDRCSCTVICDVSAHSVGMQHRMLGFCLILRDFCTCEPADLAICVMLGGTGEMHRTTSLRTLVHWKPSWKYLLSQRNKQQWGMWADMAAAGSLPSLRGAWAVEGHGPSFIFCRAHGSASNQSPWEMGKFQWGNWYPSSCAMSGLNVDIQRHMLTTIAHNCNEVLK